MSTTDFIAAQSLSFEPEEFQARLIDNISKVLLRNNRQPCLLRAPTGAGKTFIITKVLQEVSRQSKTLWFWFVPYANLIQQTEDSIASHAQNLSPMQLSRGRNQAPQNGMVVIATCAAVGRGKSRTVNYTDGESEGTKSIDQMVALARASGFNIGLVVDEAHTHDGAICERFPMHSWPKKDQL